MIFLASFLAYLGMLFFSFSLEKHYKQISNKTINKKIKYFVKALGTIFLSLSLYIFIQVLTYSLAITYWLGLLTIVAIFIAFIYSYKPQHIIKISVSLLVLTGIINLI